MKVLFTTETFSMGINMPAKTVVFTSIEKFDGEEYRWISGGEYIQMSGRAGRRGIDDRGVTILIASKKLEPEVGKQILKGKSDPLYSTFHLGYNMLLNMMRIEDLHPEDIILKSFHQFQSERALPEMKAKLSQMLAEYQSIRVHNEDKLEKRVKLGTQKRKIDEEINRIVCIPENIIPFCVPGRLVKVREYGWGVLVNFNKQRINPKKFLAAQNKNKEYLDILQQTESHYILDVLLYVKNKLTTDNLLQPGDFQAKDGRLGIVPVVLHPSNIEGISTIQLNLPHNLTQSSNLKPVELMYGELMKRFGDDNGLPVLDPLEDMEIEDKALRELVEARGKVGRELDKVGGVSREQEEKFERKGELREHIKELEESIKKASEMIMRQDLVNMKRVMRRLELCDKNDVTLLKGKVACRISAADELLTTELLFSGLFQNLDSH